MKAGWVAMCLGALVATGCGGKDCPAHTRLVDGRCVAGDEGDAGADAADCTERAFYRDVDGDGWGTDDSQQACEAETGWVEQTGDCDDAVRTTHPEAPELCNTVDDDCNREVDDDVQYVPWYRDTDGDTWGDDADSTTDCDQPDGFVERGGDCAPADTAIHPTAEEVCNGVDDDCANGADDGLEFPTWYRDIDGDTYGVDGDTMTACAQPGEYADRGGDCDDAVPAIHPGAGEVCNAIDDDCANGPDDGFQCEQGTSWACDTPCGTVGSQTCAADCSPGACVPPAEVCNYVDDDCDGLVDPGLQAVMGPQVRMSATSSTSIYEPRIEWDGAQFAIGWTFLDEIWVTTRTPALGEIDAPEILVSDSANPVAWDLAFSDTLFVSNYDASGVDNARRYAVTEYDVGLSYVDGWHPSLGGNISVTRVDSVPVAGGAVGFFQTSTGDIRTRGVLSGAAALHTGVTLSGTEPDGAVTPTGSVVVAYLDGGEMAVAIVDEDGDESIGRRTVTAVGGLATHVAIAQARADAIVGVFETNSGSAPLRAVLMDDALTAGDSVDLADEGRIEPDAIASSGTEFLVTYWLTAAGVPHHFVLRLDLEGRPNGTPVELPRIWTGGGSFVDPRAVWTGTNWALAYIEDGNNDASSGWDVYAIRFGCN